MKIQLLVLSLFAVAVPALSAESVCDDLGKAVEASVKEMSFYDESLLGETEVQATNRHLGQVFEIGRAQANLLLMQANKCQLPRMPISQRAYHGNAYACRRAVSKSESNSIPECKRDTWVRDDKSKIDR